MLLVVPLFGASNGKVAIEIHQAKALPHILLFSSCFVCLFHFLLVVILNYLQTL